jgi:branched-subunit amino acid aminotransferase/4-amino-4-deoxychorismate lyase
MEVARDRPTMIAYSRPIARGRAERLARDGAQLVTKAASLGVIPTVKHRSRLPWWIAEQFVHDGDPLAESLFIDLPSEAVLETPTSNIVAVVDGIVRSPTSGEVLEGVSLGVVAELCVQLGIPFVRDELTRDELFVASEIMLTNTTDCIVGVSSFDKQPVPFPGPILDRLLDAWSELAGVDLRRPAVKS